MNLHPSVDATGGNLLSERIKLSETSVRFPCNENDEILGVAGTIECDGNPKKHNALISFEMTQRNGAPLTERLTEELRATGIFKSTNPSIGYYRYLHTKQGPSTFDYLFELPDSVQCHSVSVRKFGTSPSDIELSEFSIYTPLWRQAKSHSSLEVVTTHDTDVGRIS